MSKTQLSKQVAELEREKKDALTKMEAIKHKLEQTNAEKEVIKRQLDTYRSLKKQEQIMEVKQSKVPLVLEDPIANSNTLSGQKSPRFNAVAALAAKDISKMQTFKDVRNERKKQKITGGSQVPMHRGNEPRVIADEPMEDDEGEHSQPPVIRMDASRDRKQGSNFDSVLINSNKHNEGSSTGIVNVFARLLQPAKPRGLLGSFAENNDNNTNKPTTVVQ